jgi:hypothetical protein
VMARSTEATIHTRTGSPALVIQGVRREGGTLVIEGKALGSMYMDMVLHAGDFLRVLKVFCSWGFLSFLLLVPFYAATIAVRRFVGKLARGQGVS